MSESLFLLLSLVGGGLIGGVFFAGLWLTTRQVLHSRHPALLTLASFLGRSLVAAGGLRRLALLCAASTGLGPDLTPSTSVGAGLALAAGAVAGADLLLGR